MRLSRALALALVLPAAIASAQAPTSYPLESAARLRLHNVTAEPATLDGKKALRLTLAAGASSAGEQLAVIEGLEFSSGVIEAELAGAPGPGAAEGARGFVGHRVPAAGGQQDLRRLLPAPDERPRRRPGTGATTRRSTSRIPTGPGTGCARRRRAATKRTWTSSRGAWTRVRIEVRGERARLYVHGNEQPTLVVNDVKTGASAKGAVALWLGPGTIAHFRNLSVRPEAGAR
jgi:hypothetical protein